jgi:hypothetical protein
MSKKRIRFLCTGSEDEKLEISAYLEEVKFYAP